jgi:hypothetical protein
MPKLYSSYKGLLHLLKKGWSTRNRNKSCTDATNTSPPDGMSSNFWIERASYAGLPGSREKGPAQMGGTRRVASDPPAGLKRFEMPNLRFAYALVRAESTPLASEPMLLPSAL